MAERIDPLKYPNTRLLLAFFALAGFALLALGVYALFAWSRVPNPAGYGRIFNPFPAVLSFAGGLSLLTITALGNVLCDIANDVSAMRERAERS